MMVNELRLSAPDSDTDWKKTGDWTPVWYRLSSKNTVFDYLRFYEMKFSFKWLTINLSLNETDQELVKP